MNVDMLYWMVEYSATFTEAMFCFLFCGTFIDREKTAAEKHLIELLAAVTAFLIVLTNSIQLFSLPTMAVSIIIFLAAQYIMWRKPVKPLIFTAAYLAILVAIDTSVLYAIAFTARLSPADIMLEHSLSRVLLLVFSKAILAILIYTVYKTTTKRPAFTRQYMISIFAFSTLILALALFVVFSNIHSSVEELTMFSVLLSIAFLGLILALFFSMIKLSDYYENKQQMTLLAVRNKMLEQSMSETEKTFFLWRASLHDHKNNILHLMTLAENKRYAELEECLSQEKNLLSKKLFYYKTGNDTVDAVLNTKQALAQSSGISFTINAVCPKECRISDVHFCSVLGNLIDNAIAACKNETEPYIEVSINPVKDLLVIKITNKFTAAKVCEPSSQNAQFHGIGLKSVEKIIKEYGGGFSAAHDSENEIYVAKAFISLENS